MVVIMKALAKGQKRNPPAVPTGIGPAMGLTTPQMADRIDAEGRIEDPKRPAHTREQEAPDSSHPAIGQKPHEKRQREATQDNWNVIPMLPHDDTVLSEPRQILLLADMRMIDEDPAAMAVPEPSSSVIRVLVSIALSVVVEMVCAPFKGGVLQRPSCEHQDSELHRRRTGKTPMRDQAMMT